MSLDRLREPTVDPPGLNFGSFLASKMLPRPLKSAQDRSNSTQEASKTAPRAPKTPARPPQEGSKTGPGGLEHVKRLQDASGEPFCLHSGVQKWLIVEPLGLRHSWSGATWAQTSPGLSRVTYISLSGSTWSCLQPSEGLSRDTSLPGQPWPGEVAKNLLRPPCRCPLTVVH